MTNDPNSKFENPRRDPEIDDERWTVAHRRHRFLTATSIILFAAVLGLAWYAYPMLQTHDASLHTLPSLTQTVGSIGDRLKEAEAKAADSSSAQQSLRDQVTDLSKNLRARIETVSTQAGRSAEEAYRRLQAQLDAEMKTQIDKLANVSERVSNLETSHEKDQVQIAQLNQELNRVREEAEQRANQQSDDLAQVRRQLEEGRSGEREQFAALKRDQDRDRRNIDAVSNRIAVEKIPFEATKNHTLELADGISLYIENTNTSYRRVSGWMWIAGDHRNLWLKNQSVQEPVIFYGNQDGQKRELVITNVTKNSVTGYLLLPKPANQTAALSGPAKVIGGAAAQ